MTTEATDPEPQTISLPFIQSDAKVFAPTIIQERIKQRQHDFLLQAEIIAGDKTSEGHLIETVAVAWFEIIEWVVREPAAIYQFDWRKWEEIIAGAYKNLGFEVILTPRSNDKGRDIIASSSGVGSVRFFDQVKVYHPGHLVTADDVRAMLGVLTIEGNVSKGIITTTSDFAPGILEDDNIKRLIPYRLELKPGHVLLPWLASIAQTKK